MALIREIIYHRTFQWGITPLKNAEMAHLKRDNRIMGVVLMDCLIIQIDSPIRISSRMLTLICLKWHLAKRALRRNQRVSIL